MTDVKSMAEWAWNRRLEKMTSVRGRVEHRMVIG